MEAELRRLLSEKILENNEVMEYLDELEDKVSELELALQNHKATSTTPAQEIVVVPQLDVSSAPSPPPPPPEGSEDNIPNWFLDLSDVCICLDDSLNAFMADWVHVLQRPEYVQKPGSYHLRNFTEFYWKYASDSHRTNNHSQTEETAHDRLYRENRELRIKLDVVENRLIGYAALTNLLEEERQSNALLRLQLHPVESPNAATTTTTIPSSLNNNHADLEAVKEELNQQRQTNAVLQDQIRTLETRVHNYASLHTHWEEEKQTLRSQIEKLAQEKVVSAPTEPTDREELNQQRQSNLLLTDQIRSLEARLQSYMSLHTMLEEERQSNASLRTQLEKAQTLTDSTLHTQMNEKLAALENRLHEERLTNASLRSQVEKAQRAAVTAPDNTPMLLEELNQQRHSNTLLNDHIRSLEARLQSYVSLHTMLEEERQSNATLRAQLEKAQKVIISPVEVTTNTRELAQQRDMNAILNDQIRSLEARLQSYASLHTQLEEERQSNVALRSQLERLQSSPGPSSAHFHQPDDEQSSVGIQSLLQNLSDLKQTISIQNNPNSMSTTPASMVDVSFVTNFYNEIIELQNSLTEERAHNRELRDKMKQMELKYATRVDTMKCHRIMDSEQRKSDESLIEHLEMELTEEKSLRTQVVSRMTQEIQNLHCHYALEIESIHLRHQLELERLEFDVKMKKVAVTNPPPPPPITINSSLSRPQSPIAHRVLSPGQE